jgi:hypothetical protein
VVPEAQERPAAQALPVETGQAAASSGAAGRD